MLDLSTPALVEIHRRSVAMLSPGAWALRREDALVLLQGLHDALDELRRRDREQDET